MRCTSKVSWDGWWPLHTTRTKTDIVQPHASTSLKFCWCPAELVHWRKEITQRSSSWILGAIDSHTVGVFLREFKINLDLKESRTEEKKGQREEKLFLSSRKQLCKIKYAIGWINTLFTAAFFHRYTRMSSELHSLINWGFIPIPKSENWKNLEKCLKAYLNFYERK